MDISGAGRTGPDIGYFRAARAVGSCLLYTSPKAWASPEGLSSAIQVMLLLTVLTLAPSVLLMTTCFVRVIVVLGFVRQALGTQSLPPSQVFTAISLFLTLLIMWPVWSQVHHDAIAPYTCLLYTSRCV